MTVNQSELYDLVAKASFLNERIEGKSIRFLADYDEEKSDKKYDLWKEKVGSKNRDQVFEKRLSLDNLTIEESKIMVSDVKWKMDCKLPFWVNMIHEIINMLPINNEKLETGNLFYQSEKNIDQLNSKIFMPFVYYGEEKLMEEFRNRKILLNHSVIIDMSCLLMNKIKNVSVKTLNYKFKEFLENETKKSYTYYMIHGEKEELTEYWNEFTTYALSGGWKDIFFEFPVLSRLIIITITNWKNSLLETINYLEKDNEELKKKFNNDIAMGDLIEVKGELSDSHNNGRGVYILGFSKGLKIVYKPRSLEIDLVWEEFIKDLAIKGLQCNIKTPMVLSYKNYGWMEYIDRIPLETIEEAKKYYYRAGVVLSIIYALGGTDFHAENIFAWGSQLALIDNETLLSYSIRSQRIISDETSVDGEAYNIIKTSVLNTCFLTLWSKGKNNEYIDLGGITSIDDKYKNSPKIGNKVLNALEYKKEIIKGFTETYDFFANNKYLFINKKSILDKFENCRFRFVIRNSQLYSNMISHIRAPKYLRDGLIYSFEVERMSTGFISVSSDESEEELWKIFQSEKEALERGDIPIFYGRGTDRVLMDSKKVLSEEYFTDSMVDRAKHIIKRMDENDKKNQVDYIGYSITMKKWRTHPKHDYLDYNFRIKTEVTKVLDDKIFLENALSIYNKILSKSIINEKGNLTWISGQYNFKTEKMSINQIGVSLYDGIIGTAVFMSALYDCTQKKEIKKNTLLLIENFRKKLYNKQNPLIVNNFELGLGSGLAGIIKGLMTIGEYLNEYDIKKDALYIAKKIEKSKIKKVKKFDVLTGSAGLILSLAEVYNVFKDEKVYQLLEVCGKNLLEKRTEDNYTIGFGCGVVGITSALEKIYTITKDEKIYEVINELCELEGTLYSNLNEHAKKHLMGWCSGIVGLGFSKLNRDALNNEKEDIGNILSIILESPIASSDDLCCGNSGIIDFIIEASIKFDDNMKFEAAKRRMMAIIINCEKKGYYSFNGSQYETIVNPSFFKGLSGIGYEMLRCVSPERYISLLY